MFVLFHLVAQKGETDQSVSYDVFVFFLTHLVSITHPPFQATINMSGGSGAEDCSAGVPPRDASNACDESAERANFASAEVRHRLTLLVLFCLSFCFLIAICSCSVLSLLQTQQANEAAAPKRKRKFARTISTHHLPLLFVTINRRGVGAGSRGFLW